MEFKERIEEIIILQSIMTRLCFIAQKYFIYIRKTAFPLWIAQRGFKFGVFSEIRSSFKFSKTRCRYSKTLQEGQEPKAVQGSNTHKTGLLQTRKTHLWITVYQGLGLQTKWNHMLSKIRPWFQGRPRVLPLFQSCYEY